MNRDELIRRLTATFLEELAEHVRVFNDETLVLEREAESARGVEAIHALFRAAHSLKGAARAVNAGQIVSAAHLLEDLLARVRDGRRKLAPELFASLLAAADAFEHAGRQFANDANANLGLTPLCGRLQRDLARPDDAPIARAAPEPAFLQSPRLSPPEPPSHAETATEPTNPGVPGNPAAHSVRISSSKLDALLRQGGELLVTRKQFLARRDELNSIAEGLTRVLRQCQAKKRLVSLGRRQRRVYSDSGAAGFRGLPKQLEDFVLEAEPELARLSSALDELSGNLRNNTTALDRVAAPLEDGLHQLRLLPFAYACDGLSRVVRDVSTAQHKLVSFEVVGGDTEVDRGVIEALREPLLHLVRNAVDHGIEPAIERARAGKSERAALRVSVAVVGETLEVTVADDGAGLDFERLQDRVSARAGATADALSREALIRTIFSPGISTAQVVNEVSGRGVGLDVVKTVTERANGVVDVVTSGEGTRFVLTFPLSLSTVRAVLVRVGSETLALPSAAIEGSCRVRPEQLHHVGDRAVLNLRGVPLPLASLAQLLDFPASARDSGAALTIVVLNAGDRRVALVVDELLSAEDLILAPLGARLRDLEYAVSAALLSTGDIALLLRPLALVGAALDARAFELSDAVATHRDTKKRLLLADDSLTTRALERSILESAGYDVVVAVDGARAWQLLQERGADLVLSDVEMPNLDGLSLTQNIRASARFRELPVILLTSRDSTDDRARGLAAGANAYLVKSAFDQGKLLQTIEQLL